MHFFIITELTQIHFGGANYQDEFPAQGGGGGVHKVTVASVSLELPRLMSAEMNTIKYNLYI